MRIDLHDGRKRVISVPEPSIQPLKRIVVVAMRKITSLVLISCGFAIAWSRLMLY
jgi:hypothetical protein